MTWLLALLALGFTGSPASETLASSVMITGQVAAATAANEQSVPSLFRNPLEPFDFQMNSIRREARFEVFAVRFPSPVTSPDAENNTVPAEFFLPSKPGKRPAVVVLHILGADFALSRYLAARLADQGVAALFVKLPYYGERRPADNRSKRFLSADLDRSVLAMRQGVCDIRRGLAWLASRPEVDADRLGVCGISLGGIMTALATAVDPRVERAAILLAGGDLGAILWDLPEPEARRYREQWMAAGRTRDDLVELTRPFDPLTYADRLQDRKLLMIAGRVDEVIPPFSVQKLWEAAGKPPLTWYDCGHYSAAGYLMPALRETVDFFAAD